MRTIVRTFEEQTHLYTLGACALLVTLFIGYIYLLSATVVHVVIRKEIAHEIATLNSEIADLEAEYISRQHAMSEEIATQKGFVAIADKIFLDRTDTSLVFSDTR